MKPIDEPNLVSAKKANLIISEVKKAIKGKDDIIKKALAAMLAGGHILLEDVPGVGKTTLALAFSSALQLSYNRVQFTPDVLPSDITGYSIYNKNTGGFEYVKGAILCNLFLADEINRTSSKTQSALLQVMEESVVTVDQVTYEVPPPFTVIATQNPVNSSGTQLLPESQLDRFLVRLSMGYPDKENEILILKSKMLKEEVNCVTKREEIIALQQAVKNCFVADEIYSYIIELAKQTRVHPLIELGVSPRGAIALMNMAKAWALINDRDYVIPQDVLDTVIPVFAHRLVVKARARIKTGTEYSILKEIIAAVTPPRI